MADLRFGLGFDSHATDPGRALVLGGERFEGEPGLSGHSDADVVCHALADALLGAAALGDLGEHFPESDAGIAGIGGLELLGRVVAMVRDAGYVPESCDLVVIAERPRVSERREAMRGNLAEALRVPAERVSLKATRPEGLGLEGEGAGCLALAVVSGP